MYIYAVEAVSSNVKAIGSCEPMSSRLCVLFKARQKQRRTFDFVMVILILRVWQLQRMELTETVEQDTQIISLCCRFFQSKGQAGADMDLLCRHLNGQIKVIFVLRRGGKSRRS